jgi:adenylate cyclase
MQPALGTVNGPSGHNLPTGIVNWPVKTELPVPGKTGKSNSKSVQQEPVRPLRRLYQLSPWLAAAVFCVGVQVSGLAQNLNLLVYDLVITLRPKASGQALPITIIGITENDIGRLGWPIDDRYFCTAIDHLINGGALAVGFDLYRDKGVGPNQDCLRERFRTNPRLVSIFNLASDIPAIPGTPDSRQSYNDLSLDLDGVLRRDLVHVTGQEEAVVSFPLRVVEVASGNQNLRTELEAQSLADAWLSADAGGYHGYQDAAAGMQRMLEFREPGSFAFYSLSELLDRTVPKDAIANQIVLIGSTAASLRDLFLVPMSRFDNRAEQLTLPGVEVHALRVATLLAHQQGEPVSGWLMPGWGNLLLTLLAAGAGFGLGESFPRLRWSVLAVGISLVVLGGGLLGLLVINAWIGTTMPLVALSTFAGAALLRRGSASQHHAQQVKRLLGQATSPAVAQQLWEQRDQLLRDGRFEGRQLAVTVLFSDTANFTSLSEVLGPSALMDWLNRGMAYCVPAVTRRGGMVNKFTGDGMLAVFGVPVSNDPGAEAHAAIEAALDIRKGLTELNRSLRADGLPPMRLRIGIHSGIVLAGSMGSSERLEYAVIGDTVNCASRLESLDKHRHIGVVRILVSSATRELLRPELDGQLRWLEWGTMSVKGRNEELRVSELQV